MTAAFGECYAECLFDDCKSRSHAGETVGLFVYIFSGVTKVSYIIYHGSSNFVQDKPIHYNPSQSIIIRRPMIYGYTSRSFEPMLRRQELEQSGEYR
jgi:hypothetical protein